MTTPDPILPEDIEPPADAEGPEPDQDPDWVDPLAVPDE